MIVIFWIKISPSRWKIFIANKTAEIQQLGWNHVPRNQNPVDIVSRDFLSSELHTTTLSCTSVAAVGLHAMITRFLYRKVVGGKAIHSHPSGNQR